MNKPHLIAQIITALEHDVDVVTRAAQSAYEAATAEENIAENKYDTLGLEASYLATGQARRSAEIRQALHTYRQLKLRDYDPQQGVQVSQVVTLEDEQGQCRRLIIGPEAAGLKIGTGDGMVMVITPRSPLGQQLMGKHIDDEVCLNATRWTVVEVI
ncbi:GreA/GreB family elongation factor [Pseudomonas fulva]|uniref:GreA/GreB family elongation factor n=1 Tax=Pseudomonas fulva TaxID=47880 RepID=UPI002DBB7774|nr:GreA/GreB family elongation factor [Pseudomonas fulva]MEC4024877.1 GreA/GreB family elongation factor [Pseudomonas fulva]